jgi:hypothetical protein
VGNGAFFVRRSIVRLLAERRHEAEPRARRCAAQHGEEEKTDPERHLLGLNHRRTYL